MEVITIESNAFRKLTSQLAEITDQFTRQNLELKNLKDNRLMSVTEVAEYTGFSPKWVRTRQAEIGCSQINTDIRFYKEDVDAYFRKHFIKMKLK